MGQAKAKGDVRQVVEMKTGRGLLKVALADRKAGHQMVLRAVAPADLLRADQAE
jgi:hypothetical protein